MHGSVSEGGEALEKKQPLLPLCTHDLLGPPMKTIRQSKFGFNAGSLERLD